MKKGLLYHTNISFLKKFKVLLTLFILICFGCKDLPSTAAVAEVTPTTEINTPKVRVLNQVTLSGSGYELGLQHGQKLKTEISEIVTKWKTNTSKVLNRNADEILAEFFEYAQFSETIKQWTPELYEEVNGIADGSGQPFNNIMVLNLLDEFWVYLDNPANHHCSDMGVPARNGSPSMVAQNMDIEGYTDGFQTLLRIERTPSSPEQLILTHPGLIVANGMNEKGIGVVVNTIMQLNASPKGLPVAFVIRKILSSSDKSEILEFVQSVPHASGQNYIIGIEEEVYDFEASANKVVRFNPENTNGTVYHTNHPIVNTDLKEWHAKYNPNLGKELLPIQSNSYIRFSALEQGISEANNISPENIKNVLRSKNDPANPVCRNWAPGKGFTFASTIMSLGETPYLLVTAGPPDESEYQKIEFTH